MKKVITVIGYIWAVACLLLIPVTFVGNQSFARMASRLSFMKVSPIYTGGEVARTVEDSTIKVEIYKPVFEALIGESKKGFIQIRFSSAEKLPPLIEKTIDMDNDGKDDFGLIINTETSDTKLSPVNPHVTGLNVSTRVKDAWVVRVDLTNPAKE